MLTIQIHEHLHKATALGFGAFCAWYFSKYDKHKGTQPLQFIRIGFQKKQMCHRTEHLICQTQENQ